MVTLASILQKVMVHVSDNVTIQAHELASEILITNTLMCGQIRVDPPACQLNYHLYYSSHDNNAKHVIEKMRAELKDGASLRVSCDPTQFDRAHQMLVFLNSDTNFSDDDELLADLRCGLKKCVRAGRDPATFFVLVHETRRACFWVHNGVIA